MSGWSPKEQWLKEIIGLLQQTERCTNDQHQQLFKRLKELETFSEFSAYLCHIFVLQTDVNRLCRQRAGLHLKNNVKRFWNSSPREVRQYVQSAIPRALADEQPQIRKFCAAVIGMMVFRGGLDTWTELIPSLVHALQSNDLNAVHGGLKCLEGLCVGQQVRLEANQEDENSYLRTCNLITSHPQCGKIVQILINYMGHQQVEFRYVSMECLNRLAMNRSQAFDLNIEAYVSKLYQLGNDDNTMVRKKMCQAFSMLIESHYPAVANCIDTILEFILHCTENGDEQMKIEAADFWPKFAACRHTEKEKLLPFLEKLVPVLLNGTRYSQEELAMINEEINDSGDENIKPWHERNTEDDFEQEASSVRRCFAYAIDKLSLSYKQELLKYLLPEIQARMQHDNWEVRETAILVLGAVSHGCFHDLEPFLPQIVPTLFNLLDDKVFLIRSISAWAISRFIGWILWNQKDDEKMLVPLLKKLLVLSLDNSQRVQQAAISAVAAILEKGHDRMTPYMKELGAVLKQCLHRYKLKNLPYLFDCLMCLFGFCDRQLLANPELMTEILDICVQRMLVQEDGTPTMFQVTEFLSHAVSKIREEYSRWLKPTWDRLILMSISYIQDFQKAEQLKEAKQDFEYPKIETLTAALDCFANIVEAFGTKIKSQIANSSDFFPIISFAMKHKHLNIRRSAMGLLGSILNQVPEYLQPHLNDLLQLSICSLNPHNESLCVNASWFIGLTADKYPKALQPVLESIVEQLATILNMEEPPEMLSPFGGVEIGPSETTFTSVAITLCRIAEKYPTEISQCMNGFAKAWIYNLGKCFEDAEKDRSYRTMIKILGTRPEVVLTEERGFQTLLESIATFFQPSTELNALFTRILQAYKQLIINNNEQDWYNIKAGMHDQLRDFFERKYGL